MKNKLCPQCIYISADDKFCEECGLSKQEISAAKVELPPVDQLASPSAALVTAVKTAATPPLQVLPAGHDTGWLKMVDVAGKVGGLGGTLIAVFDFLSPRIALLPIAASVAVVGLLATIALRKFVAPSLPAASKFRMALAPEARLHRSRLVIGTGMLSALMVTGAAWSNANEASGGIIASKSDAAKNAQIQLGIFQVAQAVQKEQRVQTAVLEDIREGRTLNPRRELSNQGILWTQRAFKDAVYSNDAEVVSLFIAGGMRWGAETGFDLLVAKQNAISDALIARPELFDRDIKGQYRRDCYSFAHFFNKPSDETKDLKDQRLQKAYLLRPQDKQWLKLLCGDKEGGLTVLLLLQDRMAEYGPVPANQCRQRLLENSSILVTSIGVGASIPFERDRLETALLRNVISEQSNGSFSLEKTPKVLNAIDDYCSMVARRPSLNDNPWAVASMKQIVAVLN